MCTIFIISKLTSCYRCTMQSIQAQTASVPRNLERFSARFDYTTEQIQHRLDKLREELRPVLQRRRTRTQHRSLAERGTFVPLVDTLEQDCLRSAEDFISERGASSGPSTARSHAWSSRHSKVARSR